MAQITYTQSFPKDAGGVKGSSILQTRGGNDEPISPISIWELDSSGLYMPPGVSANPTLSRVAVVNRNSGNTELFTTANPGSVTVNGSYITVQQIKTNFTVATATAVYLGNAEGFDTNCSAFALGVIATVPDVTLTVEGLPIVSGGPCGGIKISLINGLALNNYRLCSLRVEPSSDKTEFYFANNASVSNTYNIFLYRYFNVKG